MTLRDDRGNRKLLFENFTDCYHIGVGGETQRKSRLSMVAGDAERAHGCDILTGGQGLISNHQHDVLEKTFVQGAGQSLVRWLAKIDASDLSPQGIG